MGVAAEQRKLRNRKEWNRMLKEFVAYRKKHGHGDMITGGKGVTQLGKWVARQRAKHSRPNGSDGKLVDDQFERLEAAGFLWASNKKEMLWAKHFEYLVKYKEKHGHTQVPRTLKVGKVPLGSWVSMQRGHWSDGILKPDRQERLESINFNFAPGGKEAREKKWEMSFQRLKAIYEENKIIKEENAKIERENEQYSDDENENIQETKPLVAMGNTLNHWLVVQRQRFRNSKLGIEKLSKLQSIGFSTESLQRERSESAVTTWNKRIKALTAFRKKYGHCLVGPENPTLHSWVSHQRRRFKGSAEPMLNEEELESLNELEFEWLGQNLDAQWEEQLKKLAVFKNEKGHMWVPSIYKPDTTFGKWVATQRRLNKQGTLRADRKLKLEKAGFAWVADRTTILKASERHKTFWKEQYNKLIQFRKQHGHCLVPNYGRSPDNTLSTWVGLMRRRKRRGVLDEEHERKLNEIGFVFEINHYDPKTSVLQQIWDDRFDELVKYHKKYGTFFVSNDDETDHTDLRGWCTLQRGKYRKGDMDPGRQERLTTIGFFREEYRQNAVRRRWTSPPDAVVSSNAAGTFNSDGVKSPYREASENEVANFKATRKSRRSSKKRKRYAEFPDSDLEGEDPYESEAPNYEADFEVDDNESEDEREMELPSSAPLAMMAVFDLDNEIDIEGEVIATSENQDGGSDTDPENYDASGDDDAFLDVEVDVVLGSRISVYWSGDDEYYKGVVSRTGKGGQVFIEYDDGETEWRDMTSRIKVLDEKNIVAEPLESDQKVTRNQDVFDNDTAETVVVQKAERQRIDAHRSQDDDSADNGKGRPVESHEKLTRNQNASNNVGGATSMVGKKAKKLKRDLVPPIETMFGDDTPSQELANT